MILIMILVIHSTYEFRAYIIIIKFKSPQSYMIIVEYTTTIIINNNNDDDHGETDNNNNNN